MDNNTVTADMTIKDSAAYLGVPVSRIRRWRINGSAPAATLVGAELRWTKADWDAWLAGRKSTGGAR